jgi:hypothetical protein
VKFGGQDVGGIRVSHMSHIDKRIVVALTVSRGKRVPYTVEPLKEATPAPKPEPMSAKTRAQMFALFADLGINDRDEQVRGISHAIGRDIQSRGELTEAEGAAVVDRLKAKKAQA